MFIDYHWIGERIAQIALAIADGQSEADVAAAHGVDVGKVRESVARFALVMAESVAKDPLAPAVVVEVPRKPEAEEWSAPPERRPMQEPVEPPRTRPVTSATELEELARAATNGTSDLGSEAPSDKETGGSLVTEAVHDVVRTGADHASDIPRDIPGDEIGDYSYDRGFAIGWMAAILTIIAGANDVSPGLREASTKGLQLLEKAP